MAHVSRTAEWLAEVLARRFAGGDTYTDRELRSQVFAEIPAAPYVHLLGFIHTVLLSGLVVLQTRAMWPLVWLVTDAALLLPRLHLARTCRRAAPAGKDAPVGFLLGMAVCWVGITAAGLFACVRTGDVPSMILAGAMATIIAGTSILRNAAVPRYACFVIVTFNVSIAAAFLTMPIPGKWLIVIQLAASGAGMCVMVHQAHRQLTGMLRSRLEADRQALRDPLTGLGNRLHLHASLERLLQDHAASAGALGKPILAVLFLDLDFFKAVNDNHGHATGDLLLRKIGDVLAALLGPADIACRTGGDEFVVLVVGKDEDHLAALAQRIIRDVSKPHVVGAGRVLQIGVSIGIATAPADGKDADALLSRADAALYRAKSAGRGISSACG